MRDRTQTCKARGWFSSAMHVTHLVDQIIYLEALEPKFHFGEFPGIGAVVK